MPGLPALVVHRPSVATRSWFRRSGSRSRPDRRPSPSRSGTTSASRARSRRARDGAVPVARSGARPSRRGAAAPRRGHDHPRSARTTSAAVAAGTASRRRSARARAAAAGPRGCSGRSPGAHRHSSLKRRAAVEQRLDEQQAPAVADPIQGGLERGRRGSSDGGIRHGLDGRGGFGACHGSLSVVDCKLQVYRTHHAENPTSMSVIEELQTAVGTVAEPSRSIHRRHRPRDPRLRRRPCPGQGPDQRPQPAR